MSLSPAPWPTFGAKILGHPFPWIPYTAVLVTELPQLKEGQPRHNFPFFISSGDVELTGD